MAQEKKRHIRVLFRWRQRRKELKKQLMDVRAYKTFESTHLRKGG